MKQNMSLYSKIEEGHETFKLKFGGYKHKNYESYKYYYRSHKYYEL